MRGVLNLLLGLACLSLCGCESEALWDEAPMANGGEAAAARTDPPSQTAPSQTTRPEPPAQKPPQTHRVGRMALTLDGKWASEAGAPQGMTSFIVQDDDGNIIGRILVMEIPPQIPLQELASKLARQFGGSVADADLVLDGQPAYRLQMPGGSQDHPEASILVEYNEKLYNIAFSGTGRYDFSQDLDDVIASVKFD